MFHVAVCDDNSIFLSDFKKQISSIFKEQNMNYEIDCFSNISEFIQETKEGTIYQLVFMDIEFPDTTESGLYGADYIRNFLSESNIHIVFISSQPKYAMCLFDFQPLQFLIKPINRNKLVHTIQKSINLWNCNNSVFHFISNRQNVTIDIHQILYIEAYGRKKILHCISGKTYSFNDSFAKILNQLEPYNFFSPHKSYIVNYVKVAVWQKETMVMENGDVIPIGRSQQKKVQDLQLKHFFDKEGLWI